MNYGPNVHKLMHIPNEKVVPKVNESHRNDFAFKCVLESVRLMWFLVPVT